MHIGELKVPQSTKEELVKNWDGKRGSFNPASNLTLAGVDYRTGNRTASITILHDKISQIVQDTIRDEIEGMFDERLLEALEIFNPSVIISGGGSRVKCIVDSLKGNLRGRDIELVGEQFECILGAIHLFETSPDFYSFLRTVDFSLEQVGKGGHVKGVRTFPQDEDLKWGKLSVQQGNWNLFWKHHFNIHLCIAQDGYISLAVLPGSEDDGTLYVVQDGRPIDEVDIVYDRFSRNIFTRV